MRCNRIQSTGRRPIAMNCGGLHPRAPAADGAERGSTCCRPRSGATRGAPAPWRRGRASADWWRGAVIYQIYPRSFLDTDGDGVGDLPGVIARLDYIASLGVDAIWISPFFKSPMKDFGYDISRLPRRSTRCSARSRTSTACSRRRTRAACEIMIDQVLSHTSNEHAWFEESRQSRDNAKADWYVWADPKPDGTPPNNWLSIFGGAAWQWEPRRGQYYLHNFLRQPAGPELPQPGRRGADARGSGILARRAASTASASMRSTSASTIRSCATTRRSRRPSARAAASAPTIPTRSSCTSTTTRSRRTSRFLEALRRLLDRYAPAVALGEVSAEDAVEAIVQYTAGASACTWPTASSC